MDVRHDASMQVLDEKRRLRLRREAAVLHLTHTHACRDRERERGREREREGEKHTPLIRFNKEGYITVPLSFFKKKKTTLSSLV